MPLKLPTKDHPPAPVWEDRIPEPEWAVYQRVIEEIRAANVRVAFGGAFATAAYTGILRNTKDFDFYVLPEDREALQSAISRAGLTDYFDRLPYDRSWIYRASRGEIIVDAIWAMANQRATVDEHWLSHGPEFTIRGERLRAIPIEELIWSKLYVLQRERSDWGDVLNLIDAGAESLEWDHLLRRLDADAPLLAGVLSVFAWLAPDRVSAVDPAVWGRLSLDSPDPNPDPALSRARARLLDSRPWFRIGE
jgi:hypothetical protein